MSGRENGESGPASDSVSRQKADLSDLIISLTPEDGSSIGNGAMMALLRERIPGISEDGYAAVRDALVDDGLLAQGRGRGGSIYRTDVADFDLTAPEAPKAKPATTRPRKKAARKSEPTQVLSYRHGETRVNNPEVGMVHAGTDPDGEKMTWEYDPHLDPVLNFDSARARIETLIDDALASEDMEWMKGALEELKRLQAPYLNWTGKAERLSFEVDTVSLHVHERVDPATILANAAKRLKGKGAAAQWRQSDLFAAPFENLPLRQALDFYQHEKGWSNRLVTGDSLLVMNSLLTRESMGGKVQMIYIDPPYGIKYGSNFQPFTNRRDVKDRSDADLTQEPEMIKAFRDTWELGIHSYLTYLRDRLMLARELLTESGSIFVQISDENVHHVRELMAEVFGVENFRALIPFKKTSSLGSAGLDCINDYHVWYSTTSKCKFNRIYLQTTGDTYSYPAVEEPNGDWRRLTAAEKRLPTFEGKLFRTANITSQSGSQKTGFPVEMHGLELRPSANSYWKTNQAGISRLKRAGRILPVGSTLTYKRLADDFPVRAITNWWDDTVQSTFAIEKDYVVQSLTQKLFIHNNTLRGGAS